MWAAMTRSIEMIVALIEYYSGTVVNASIAVDNTGGGSHLHEQYTLRYGRSNSLTLHPPKFIDSTRSYAQRRVFFLNFCVLMPSAGPLTLTPQSWFISATLTQPRHIIHPPPNLTTDYRSSQKTPSPSPIKCCCSWLEDRPDFVRDCLLSSGRSPSFPPKPNPPLPRNPYRSIPSLFLYIFLSRRPGLVAVKWSA